MCEEMTERERAGSCGRVCVCEGGEMTEREQVVVGEV